jgi:predicted nucleic acid-binding protein
MSERERARRAEQRRRSLEVNEFCNIHRICRDRFYAEVRAGKLRARKVGRKTIVTPEDEDAWVANLPVLELATA